LRFPPRLDRWGVNAPLGPHQFPQLPWPSQERQLCQHGPPGCRRCLLKGCECWFRPRRPQARYCSAACRQEAKHWRRWHAARCYRASDKGKARRRQQSQRYRERARQRQAAQAAVAEPPREGQRPAQNPQDLCGRPCDRPGCYQLFIPTPRSPQQHFCSCSCREALRRVRQRESRLRERRRRGVRPRRRRFHDPPPSPH
jgi:hypothetical protein